ncbi:MAG TPA: putative photosynthetic complex assembly protein PuhE [Chloroflexia bacterium]|nr:putative photosynthetic complex assembly protein PuhE [Chloroflexia bacterium]
MNFWLDVVPPVIAAVLIWWGATGTIIYLCGRKAWRPWVFLVVTALQPLAFWRLWIEKNSAEVGGVFAAFFWAIIIWSWIETSYYTGFVVGRKVPELDPDAPTGLRFRRAIAANLYHELAILGLSLAVIIVGWGGANDTGLWAFMILHWTHQSAKINIFLGISNLTTEYLPDNLKYMAQYFSQKPLNAFFPFSATITTALSTWLFSSILSARTAGEQTGQALLFVMMTAAVLEHWWLVTPVPTRIWKWALKSRRNEKAEPAKSIEEAQTSEKEPELAPGRTSRKDLPEIYVICGYLGSGKTTLIRQLLPQLDGRVAVVVNDFGTVGVDAELIRAEGHAGAVLELPGGCVCCTLQKNLSGQLLKLLEDYRPERILIEPSGVAGIEEIVRTLASPRLAGRFGKLEVITVVEMPRLMGPEGLQKFTLTQIKAAAAIVISKTDLVQPREVVGALNLITTLNPRARLFPAVAGQVSAGQLLNMAVQGAEEEAVPEQAAESVHSHEHHDAESGLISFAKTYEGLFDSARLKHLFDELAGGYYGPVERAKGLFYISPEVRQNWDLANGRVYCRTLSTASGTILEGPVEARFMLVARDLAADRLCKRLQSCIIQMVPGAENNFNRLDQTF